MNKEVFSTLEFEEENKERKRSEDQPGKQGGVWSPQKVFKETPSRKTDKRDGNWSTW